MYRADRLQTPCIERKVRRISVCALNGLSDPGYRYFADLYLGVTSHRATSHIDP